MAVLNNTFYLIEFEDGIQVVPDDWIQKDTKKCWYPNFKRDKDINKAIKKRLIPQDDWLLCSFKRVFGIYESYSEACKKLKKAEMTSDVNTDTDKTKRKVRARKQSNTDDDESDCSNYQSCLPPYPKAPMIHTNTKNTQKEDEYITIRNTKNVQEEDEYITIRNYLQRIERMLADIKFDVNHLTEQYQLILTKLNLNVSNRTRENRSPTPNDELSELSFPLKTIEEIEFLQKILASSKEGLKEHMVSYVNIYIYI
ncbi:uncharacterized protein [Linepithema humile]|uniref:uncharacterized protein isoform X1 n=1 Tax=Linepithema humile TaxID=83485 RepID=UPI00351EA340